MTASNKEKTAAQGMIDCPHMTGDSACVSCTHLHEISERIRACVTEQRKGFDVLASAAWDDLVRYWQRNLRQPGEPPF